MSVRVCVAYLIYYREINLTHSYKNYKVIENNPKLESAVFALFSSLVSCINVHEGCHRSLASCHAPKYSPAVSLTHTNTLQFLQRIPGGLRVHSNSGTELPHCPGQPHACSAFQPFPSKALKSGSIESIGA